MIGDVARLMRTAAVRAAGALPVVGPALAPRRSLEIDGSVVFITGAARGLGAEVARQAHARGARVALVGRRMAPLQDLADELGEGAAAFGADVTDDAALHRAADGAVKTFGGIDVVIANAGIAPPSQTVATMSREDFEHTVDVDLLGQWRTARATLSSVTERGGHVLFVGSVYAFFNGVLAAPYAVSKAGVEQLARTLRVELARHDATAGIAYLGFIDTDLATEVFADDHAAAIRQVVPDFITAPMSVEDAAAAVLAGVQRRAPRVSAPTWVAPLLAVRSLTTAVMDQVLLTNPGVARAIGAAEADARG